MQHPDFPNTLIKGMAFRGAEAVEYTQALQGGERLILELEPENPFDMNAIKALTPNGKMHLGYIERGQASWISGHMLEGAQYVAEVVEVVPYKKTLHILANVKHVE